MPSPTCLVKDGGGSFVSTTAGVDVTPGNTITIKLNSLADVNAWLIQCATTDDLSDAVAVSSALVIDGVAKTATFTAPAAGRAYRFRSRVNGGVDVNGIAQPSYETYFVVYTKTASPARRVHALDEKTEGGAFGWGADINDLIRNPGGGGSTNGFRQGTPVVEKTANYTITTSEYLVVFVTNPNLVATLPASPAAGDIYKVSAQTTGCSVNGGGHNINGAATISLVQYQQITFTYSSGSGIWIAE